MTKRMSKMVEKPDLELMLRGRPMKLPRVHIIPPASSRAPRHATKLLAALRRHRTALAVFAAAGGLLGLAIALLDRPWYEARAVIEPPPSQNTEVEVKQLTDPGLVATALAKAQLERLPEFSGRRTIDILRRFLRIQKKPEAGALLRDVLGNLRVTASPQRRVVDIAFRATDPHPAVAFANLLINGLQELEIKLRTAGAKDPLAGQITDARMAMQRAEDDLNVYRHTKIDQQSGAVIENRFAQVKNEIAELESKFPSDSPAAGEARKLAAALRKAQGEYKAARTKVAIRYQAKKQDLETKRAIYDELVKKRQAVIAAANAEKTSRVLVAPHLAGDPIRPNLLVYVIYGLLGGILVGTFFRAVQEPRATMLQAPGEIAKYVKVPELGTVPHMKLDPEPCSTVPAGIIDLSRAPGEVQRFAAASGLAGSRYSADSGESFRSVLASIWLAGQNGKRPRVLLFASPRDGEGKTSIVTNLGIALANTNRRVLILEADLRRPRLHTVLGTPNSWGLANMLEEQSPVEEYRFENLTLRTDIPGLYVLPAGTGEPNIANVRYVDRLGELLTRFRLEFHAVLVDTPGALEFPDARVIGRLSDGAVLVFRCGTTDRERAAALCRRFKDDGINVLGAVLNDYTGN